MLCCAGRRKPPRSFSPLNDHDIESAPLLSEAPPDSTPTAPPPLITPLQHAAHGPLHFFLILRALRRGYLPSTVQLCFGLRRLEGWFADLESAVLETGDREGEEDGVVQLEIREQVRLLRVLGRWVECVAGVFEEKVRGDEIQKIVWGVGHKKPEAATGWVGVGVTGLQQDPQSMSAGWAAVKTIVKMVLREEEVNGLLGDIAKIVRTATGEAAIAVGEVAGTAGEDLIEHDNGEEGNGAVKGNGFVSENNKRNSKDVGAGGDAENVEDGQEELGKAAQEAAHLFTATVAAAGESAAASIKENVVSPESDAGKQIRARFARIIREAIIQVDEPNARKNFLREYLIEFVKTWLGAYMGGGVGMAGFVMPEYMRELGGILTRFGKEEEWSELARRMRIVIAKVLEGTGGHSVDNGKGTAAAVVVDADDVVAGVVEKVGEGLAELFENPQTWNERKEGYSNGEDPGVLMQVRAILREALMHPIRTDGTEQYNYENISFSKDLDDLLNQLHTVYLSVIHDPKLTSFLQSTATVIDVLFFEPSPPGPNSSSTHTLLHTLTSSLLPRIISRIPCVPIPRLEVLSPTADLLLENLIITPIPSKSPITKSLLPSTISIRTHTNLNLTVPGKASGTSTSIHINNLTPLTAQKVGYILRLHPSWLLPTITSTGLLSLTLPKGISIVITHHPHPHPTRKHPRVAVKIRIPELTYSIQDSTGCGGFMTLLRPILSPMIRKLAEARIEEILTELCADMDTEVFLARQRVRGAAAAGHEGWVDVARAVWVGLGETVLQGGDGKGQETDQNDEDEDGDEVEVSFGISGGRASGKGKGKGKGKSWEGVYAPGSVVGMWEAEEERERLRDMRIAGRGRSRVEGWRSSVFDW